MDEVSALSTRLNHLSLAKRALIEKRLRGQLSRATESPAIPKRTADETAPLSFAQHRLWFVDQLESGSASYNMPAAVRLAGELQIDALGRSFSEIIRRHEILRAVFTNIDGNPVQTIKPAIPLTLPVIDLSQLDKKEREAELRRLTSEEAQRPFDLESGPLLRVSLVKLGEEEHVLLLTLHHIVSDAWSMSILVREVAALYEAYSQGLPSPLEELPIQYADYAAWQREWLRGEVLKRQLSYWQEQLGGELPVLELPTDHQRPNVQSYRGGQVSFTVNEEVTSGLQELSRRHGATLFMTLLSAFEVLLMRYSSQEDVIVGTDIANRTRTETEALIGFFVNQLVMRTDLSGDPTFEELLGRVREVCLGAYAHQDVPFEKLVEELAPERSLSRTPLFQVKFLLQNTPAEGVEVSGLRLEALRSDSGAARFELTVAVTEYEGRLLASVLYNADLFERETIERMGEHFQTLLAGVVADPTRRLSQLPLLTAVERRQACVEWNETAKEYPRQKCLHQLFEEQAERTPAAVALSCQDRQVSYRELNERANELAHYLRSLGVGPEVLVGVCLERSVEMVVAVLGILKAGGAYLPLDPEYPLERLAWMLEDSNVPLLLTEEQLSDHLPTHWGQTICLDSEWERITKQSAENPVRIVAAENLAYVIYTSGSTGKPKGVMVPHRGLSNLVSAQSEFLGLAPGSRMLQFASASFDAAAFEVYTALCNGAALCLATREESQPGPAMVRLMCEQGVTAATLPPSVLSVMEPDELPQLKTVISVAEACMPGTVERWAKGGRRFLNGYGPTEASVAATVTGCLEAGGGVTIGRPLANVQVYVLDSNQQVVPIGVSGEIYIGGEGLARGYLNRPELTAERFIPHPYSADEGARLYRTGDLGRYKASGEIEYLGRADGQVKVRGYRIELGEIEAALRQHPSVKDAVVIAREDEANNKSLVVYCVHSDSHGSLVGETWRNELRRFLKESLPEYMVPTAFVQLDQLPLTPNGKVDRAALPAFEQMAEKSVSHVEPRTAVEELLTGIWSEILKVPQVSLDDNFFELGGHSLLATQLVSRIREVFQLEVPLRLLFEQPTVALLAENIETLLHDSQSVSTAPPIESAGRERPLPPSFAQQRLWFIDQLESGSAFYNMPTALHLTGKLNVNALEQALGEIIRRHEILRTRFVMVEGEPAQEICEAYEVSVAVTDLSGLGERGAEEAKRLAQEEARCPFDLSWGPMLRAQVLRLGEEEHVVLLTLHHIVSDAWSMGVLVKEVAALYSAFSGGQPSPLPELPIQYADYAAWQRAWLGGETLEEELSYWRGQLGGELPVLELPIDHVRPSIQSYRGGLVSFEVSEEVASKLKTLSQRQGATLFMTLLGAFQVLLMRYSGEEEVVVGTPVAGRTRTELESLIGFFVNTLVLRGDLSGNPTFEELLGRVREVCLGAYAHQDVPFEKLVEELQPERSLSRTPLFQVLFALQNATTETLEVPGLAIRALHTDRDTAEFDLTLAMVKAADRLYATFEYNADLFERTTIERMCEHFQTLLAGIVSDTTQHIWQLPLLSEEERRQACVEWNETAKEYPRQKCLHQLFEEQAERTPAAVALSCEGEQVSYRELNERANRLAHHLRSLGVGPEVLVGVCLERSIEMVVAVLGILKAGGAYLPLDPEYPLERLAWMLNDGNVPLLLTEKRFTERLQSQNGRQARVICLDSNWGTAVREGTGSIDTKVTAENLAYVIYTSGSTGKPKGVMVAHGGLSNLVTAQADFFGLAPGSRMLQFASISFDAATFEIFTALCNGATLCLASPEQSLPGPGLVSLLREQGVTNATLPPSVLAVLEPDELPQLRTVISIAEACTPGTVERWATEGRRFLNGYGPTEASVAATATECQATERVVTIGGPLANVQMYVLDRHQQVVPIGVAGEIYIGGEGLARGYLNCPDLTAERFLAHPFSSEEGARLYRTGDVGRYTITGEIEYLGRVDQQVKVRGYRIEVGEVEAVLSAHPAVREAVVVARQDAPGETRLVAYMVVDKKGAAGAQEVRGYLRTKLPSYMIPSAFVLLDELPLTPNGKVDRAALPVPDTGKRELTKAVVAPRNELEQVIIEIWRDVLNVEAISIHDNFFDLGGHSLLIAKAHARLQDALETEFSMVHMFEHPTVSSLAEFFTNRTKEQSTDIEIKTRGETRKDLLQKQKLLRQNRRAMVKTIGAENE